jgi:hypothetical protein
LGEFAQTNWNPPCESSAGFLLLKNTGVNMATAVINIAFGRGGLSSVSPEWSRNDSSELGGSGVIYSNLKNENGMPMGVGLSCSAAFSGQSSSAAVAAAGGWPIDIFLRHAFLTSNLTRSLTFSGLPANTDITLAIAGHRGTEPTRDLNFTWGGNAGTYDNSGTTTPTAPHSIVGTTNGVGVIVLVIQTTTLANTAYLNGLSLSYETTIPDSALVNYYLSDSKATSATVSVRTKTAGNLQLKYSTNSNFSGALLTSAKIIDIDKDYLTKFDLDGLAPDTIYYYQAVQDGSDDLSLTATDAVIPKFKTSKDGRLNFRIGLSSCALTASTSTVFNRLRARNPDVFIHHGDLHYADIATNDLALKRDAYLRALQSKTQNNFFRSCSLLYRYDDHDYGTNNSGATYAGKTNSAVAVREIFPQSRVNDSGSIESVATRGRVKFIQLDTRYEKNGALMLGATQLAWLKSLLTLTALEIASGEIALVIVDVSIPWIAASGGDTWQDAAAERTDIANHIWSVGLQQNIVFVAGDMHGCAYDNGTNNKYDSSARSGWPVIQSGALDNTGSAKGGPYTSGSFAAGGQYSIVDIVDNGSEVVGTVTAYSSSDSVLYTASFSVPAVEPAQTTAGRSIAGSEIKGHFIKGNYLKGNVL